MRVEDVDMQHIMRFAHWFDTFDTRKSVAEKGNGHDDMMACCEHFP